MGTQKFFGKVTSLFLAAALCVATFGIQSYKVEASNGTDNGTGGTVTPGGGGGDRDGAITAPKLRRGRVYHRKVVLGMVYCHNEV